MISHVNWIKSPRQGIFYVSNKVSVVILKISEISVKSLNRTDLYIGMLENF